MAPSRNPIVLILSCLDRWGKISLMVLALQHHLHAPPVFESNYVSMDLDIKSAVVARIEHLPFKRTCELGREKIRKPVHLW